MKRSRWPQVMVVALACVLVASMAGAASSAPRTGSNQLAAKITLKPTSGPPTSHVGVLGSGFAMLEPVSVRWDGAELVQVAANIDGKFSAHIYVPGAALPGKHTVDALGLYSGADPKFPFLVATNWPQYGFDAAHTGSNAYENVLSTQNVGTMQVIETFLTGAAVHSGPTYYTPKGARPGPIPPPICPACGIYFGSDDGTLYGLDGTGRIKFQFPTGGPILGSAAVFEGTTQGPDGALLNFTRIVFASSDGNLYAVDPAGRLQWSAVVGPNISSPLVVKTTQAPGPGSPRALDYYRILIGNSQGTLFAFDLNGVLLWSHTWDTVQELRPAAHALTDYVFEAVDDTLYKLSLSDGSIAGSPEAGRRRRRRSHRR